MRAIVLAGGKGTRLAPYTKILPKPLMPIDDMPILEVLLRQMKVAGVEDVILTVGHEEAVRQVIDAGKGTRRSQWLFFITVLNTHPPLGSILKEGTKQL